ncbi:MAG: hypothetical protein WD557_02260 [Dehalococcoidia bacterium]
MSAEHVLAAIEMLRGNIRLEDLGRPVSPLVPRPPERGTEPHLRDLVQRWWRDLGEDVNAVVDGAGVERLIAELGAIRS